MEADGPGVVRLPVDRHHPAQPPRTGAPDRAAATGRRDPPPGREGGAIRPARRTIGRYLRLRGLAPGRRVRCPDSRGRPDPARPRDAVARQGDRTCKLRQGRLPYARRRRHEYAGKERRMSVPEIPFGGPLGDALAAAQPAAAQQLQQLAAPAADAAAKAAALQAQATEAAANQAEQAAAAAAAAGGQQAAAATAGSAASAAAAATTAIDNGFSAVQSVATPAVPCACRECVPPAFDPARTQ